jgi:hypothetical protein
MKSRPSSNWMLAAVKKPGLTTPMLIARFSSSE